MIRNDTEPETNRGQVGIGTLIVFIAMVLVAAIAAGVLINTAGFLQTQAEDTGTESTEQVANNINVITEVGEVSSSDDIDELRIGVQPTSGTDNINLAELTLQYVSDDDFANLVVDENDQGEDANGDTDPAVMNKINNSDDNTYLVDVVTAEQPGDIVMTDGADRYDLVVPLNETADSLDSDGDQPALNALTEGHEVEVRITTQVGAQVVSFMQVPDSLSGEEEGTGINL